VTSPPATVHRKEDDTTLVSETFVGEEAFSLDNISPRDSVSQSTAMASSSRNLPGPPLEEDSDDDSIVELSPGVTTESKSEVSAGTSRTEKKWRRMTQNLANSLFSKVAVQEGTKSVMKWVCHLCRDKGIDKFYTDLGATTTSRLKHLKNSHLTHPEVQDTYPDALHQHSAQAGASQGTLTLAYTKDALLEHLVCFIAGDNVPMRIVESPQFRGLIGLLSKPALRDMPSDASMPDAIDAAHSKV